jgi:hypothetical protein
MVPRLHTGLGHVWAVALFSLIAVFPLEAVPHNCDVAFVGPVPRTLHVGGRHIKLDNEIGKCKRTVQTKLGLSIKAQQRSASPLPFVPTFIPSDVPSDSPERPLTERVTETIHTLQHRDMAFSKYASDISGKTGLGAIAALA